MSEEIFWEFERIYKKLDDNIISSQAYSIEKIHMKLIFDALNESLDALRPFGLAGKTLPWKLNAAR